MRRPLATALGALLALVFSQGVVGAQEAAPDESSSPTADAQPAQLTIESVDVGGHPRVTFTASLTANAGGALPSEAFTVLENGEPRDAEIALADRSDLQVMLLIDTTGSMTGEPLAGAKSAATTFIDELHADVQLAILGYDTHATAITDFSARRDEHRAGIAGLAADGSTAMYDAVLTAVDAFPEGDASRVIVLLTDGEDNHSETTVDQAAAALTERGVTLHSVEYLTAYNEGQGIRAMANATGGAVLRANDSDALRAVYRQLAANLVSRYAVTYTSGAAGLVDVEARVDHDGLMASGRRTIVLPTPPSLPAERTDADEATPPVLTQPQTFPPAAESGLARTALVWGALLWFLAIAIGAATFFGPRRRRVDLGNGAVRRAVGRNGMSGLANRATLVAERGLERRGYRSGLNAALERAGINLRPGEFVVIAGCAGVTATIVGLVAQGWPLAVLLALMTAAGCRLAVSVKERRRQDRFANQLGDVLQLLTGSLRAGYSLMQAVDAVSREAEAPAAEEFARLVVEIRLGRDMTSALSAMVQRTGSLDFDWVVQAIQIHREVGGDLAEVLDTVAGTIRERDHVRRQIRSLSAEGRISGYVLMALPFVAGFGIYVINPSYMGEFIHTGLLGWGLIGSCLLLMTAGGLWMRKLVKIVF